MKNTQAMVRCFCGLTLILVCSAAALSQPPGRDMQKESMIWEQLKVIAPRGLDDFKAATDAMDSGNYDEAVRLYESVYKKAPGFDHVLRRLGTSLVLQGKIDEGLRFLEEAVDRNRTADNLFALAQLLAYPAENKDGTPRQKARAFSLIKEAADLPKVGDDGDYQILLAQLALESQDVPTFRRATEKLVATHQDYMVTHYFNALLAAHDGNRSTAESEIKKAESMGLPHEVAQQFLDSGVHQNARLWRFAVYGGALVGVWAIGLVALFFAGRLMSKRTLRSVEEADPNVVTSSAELSLRKWYRQLINLAGIYYYLSIPFVIFLVLGAAAAATYISFALGRIPIKLLFFIIAGALITCYKMIRSLFLKFESEDPGRALSRDEAPGLWELTEKVAKTVNTRAVDEIRVTPGTDLAVYEMGNWREKANDQARRILILGVGVLNGFDLNGFRAVLAHEYGHFSHRDTAGGEVALRVNADMMKFAHAMILAEQNVWWNLAFQFLRIYDFIFRRISHGATRLQEVLADRVAALKYGAQAFEAGLTHVILKSAEFDVVATREIGESANSLRVLQNLYELTPASSDQIEQVAAASLNRETTEDDTHPSPTDRFRLARKVTSQTEPPISGMVWDLFKDRAALTREMTAMIQSQL